MSDAVRARLTALALRALAGATTGALASLLANSLLFPGPMQMVGLNLALGGVLGLLSPTVRPSPTTGLLGAGLVVVGAVVVRAFLSIPALFSSSVYDVGILVGAMLFIVPPAALARGYVALRTAGSVKA